MRQRLSVILISGTLIAMGGAAMAHHSFAMFDNENQIDLEGVVQEFKYTSPHTFILLEVKAQDGSITVWNLEGVTPSALAREGWSSKSLKAGDELKMTIAPLRSGAPGGRVDPAGHQVSRWQRNRDQPLIRIASAGSLAALWMAPAGASPQPSSRAVG
jgi:hypothetical protein